MSDVKNNIFFFTYIDCTKSVMSIVKKKKKKPQNFLGNFDYEESANL